MFENLIKLLYKLLYKAYKYYNKYLHMLLWFAGSVLHGNVVKIIHGYVKHEHLVCELHD